MTAKRKTRGTCDGCGKYPRLLTHIESGQRVCRSCLRRIRAPRPPASSALATDQQFSEARALGVVLPPDVSRRDAETRLRFARRRFEITDELLSEDHDRLFRLQDDVLGYVADTWQQFAGEPLRESQVPWWDQQEFAASIVTKHRPVAIAIQRVQRQRERRRNDIEAEFATTHPGGHNVPWDAFQQRVAEDSTYHDVVRLLQRRWRTYLPKRPGLLARLLFGRRTREGKETEESNDTAT